MSVLCPVGHKCWSNTCWQSKSIAVACHCETHKRNTAPPLLQAQLHYTFPLLWLQGARSPFGAWGWAQQCLSAAPSLSCVLVAPCRLFSTVLPVSQSFLPFAGCGGSGSGMFQNVLWNCCDWNSSSPPTASCCQAWNFIPDAPIK